MLSLLATLAGSIISTSLATHPFRLRLEDVCGMKPNIFRTYDYYTDVQQHTAEPTRYGCSPTGHVLVVHPICDHDGMSDYNVMTTPLLQYVDSKGTKDLCLIDGMRLFSTSQPCFRCFVTGRPSSDALALRIQDTCIWLLVSSCFDLLECNECSSMINRREFSDIQQGFLRLLLKRNLQP